jgi:CubicO group peptidase (beta-lactamase class C family)
MPGGEERVNGPSTPAAGATLVAFALSLAAIVSSRAQSLDPDALRSAADYSSGHKGTALIVIRDGRMVFSEFAGSNRSRPMKIYSGTKGFWNLAALAAQEDGILKLDDRVAETIPEWSSESRKSSITVRQLLNFSAGLNDAFSLHNDGWKNRGAHALKQPVVGTPGRSFIYGPAALQVFHEVLRRRLAPSDETPTHYLERRVLRPLGLGRQRYLPDESGNPLLAAGFVMSATDWARMGKAILRDGAPSLKRGMADAFRGSSANPMFGLGFWNNRLAGTPGSREVDPEDLLDLDWHQQRWANTCLSHAAPSDLVASVGSGGQRLYVVPSLDLIVVRQGLISKFSDGEFLGRLFGK